MAAATRSVLGRWVKPLLTGVLELSGLCAIVVGVSLVSVPAGLIVGGSLMVVLAVAVDRRAG